MAPFVPQPGSTILQTKKGQWRCCPEKVKAGHGRRDPYTSLPNWQDSACLIFVQTQTTAHHINTKNKIELEA